MRTVFLVPSLKLSGGLNVVMEHGSRLARDHGFDVTMAITHHPGEDPWPYEGLGDVRVVDVADLGDEAFDLAVATGGTPSPTSPGSAPSTPRTSSRAWRTASSPLTTRRRRWRD